LASPDAWSAHYNLGNYYQGRGMYQEAIESYNKAVELEDEAVMPLVNVGMAYSILGNNVSAEERLKKALEVDPDNSVANLNYGLLMAQTQRFEQAKTHLIRALKSDSNLSVAAYNLAVIAAQSNLTEALKYISRAHELDPDNAKYGYTLAFYSYQNGNQQIAIFTLLELIKSFPNHIDAHLFLGNIYEETKNKKAAINIYEKAAKIENIPLEYSRNIQMKANSLKE
jgi:tetratricopeptide (TPR) repeat protein